VSSIGSLVFDLTLASEDKERQIGASVTTLPCTCTVTLYLYH